MKLTVRQLKRLIKEAFSETVGDHSGELEEAVTSLNAPYNEGDSVMIPLERFIRELQANTTTNKGSVSIADIKAAIGAASTGAASGTRGSMKESLKKLVYREVKKNLIRK